MLMKKIRIFFTAAIGLLLALNASAQNMTVSGKVTDTSGEPLAGAAVIVEGTSNGIITTTDGSFSINAPADGILNVTFIGFVGQAVPVNGQKNLNIVLEPDLNLLDETIVVAYGTAKKASFTGSVTTVKKEALENISVSNVGKALEGAVSGVQISSSTGTPGSGASIIVRGIGSISTSQSPLIVVDGVPYEGSLNSISTQDIESMTILKDAAANSMYGARGSNGVIIITTKGSRPGTVKVNFEAKVGVNTRGVPTYDIVTNKGEYYEMMYEAVRNSLIPNMGYLGASEYAAQNLIGGYLKYNIYKDVADNNIIDPLTGKITDAARAASFKWSDNWLTDVFRPGLRQEYNANVAGGNDRTQAYASVGYLSDKGYVVNSGFDRISGRVKVDQKIGKNVKIGGNIAFARTTQDQFGTSESSNYSNIFMFTQQIAPIYPIYLYDVDGTPMLDNKNNRLYDFGSTYQRPYAQEQNPYATSESGVHKLTRDNLSSRGFFEWKFLKDFTFTANVAYDVFNTEEVTFYTPIGGDALSVNGREYREISRYGAFNANQLLNWAHSFGDHNVSALLGHETKSDKSSYFYGHMTNFTNSTNYEFANAVNYQDMNSNTGTYSLEGFFIKAEYDYKDRYYLTASFRRDGSSNFHPDVRWGSFWAVGASWRIKEEPFMKEVDWVDNLKLKVSYGTQGNDNTGKIYEDLYRVDRVDGSAAFTKVLRGNPEVTWEKSNNFNTGLEASFFNRINLDFEFFIKETKDLLYQSPLPASEGSPAWIWKNEMDMRNTGFELELNTKIIDTRNVKWDIALNATHYRNQLTKLPSSKPADMFPDGYQAGSYWRKLGGSLYDWYTHEYVGVDPSNGLPMYNKYTPVLDKDGNETGEEEVTTVNTASEASYRQTGKSALPDLTGGISTTLQAYGFDLSIQTAYQLGGYVMDSFYQSLMSSGEPGGNFHRDMFNRWTPTHTDTNIPALRYNSQTAGIESSDFYLTKASYFSLKNVTLGYTLPSKLTQKISLQRVRFFVMGDNIWLTSARKGLDPRQSFSGSTGYNYSAIATWSLGVNVSF